MLGPLDALEELEAQAQGGFSFEIFVQVRLGEQQQSFAVDAFCGEVLDKGFRRAKPREKSSYLVDRPRVGVVGQPRRRIVEGAASPTLLRRRRRRRDATRRAGVSRAASAGHFCLRYGRSNGALLVLLLPPPRQAVLVRRGCLSGPPACRWPTLHALHALIGAYRLVRCSGQSWQFFLVSYKTLADYFFQRALS